MMVKIVNIQDLILQEIADPKIKRDSIALTYAFCIQQSDEVDFAIINKAIRARWSVSGLIYIKRAAWRQLKP